MKGTLRVKYALELKIDRQFLLINLLKNTELKHFF